jgi:probable F420-dependent oxidoreductase
VKFMIEYPIRSDEGGTWLKPENMAEFARVAEAAGVDAIALTDHPAPSKKWLDTGGHETLDPFAGLSYFAAVTSTVRLMTYLTVLPYRNPLVTAKAMTSVDVLSGGRATFVLGTGYLRSEFGALGVDFDERNDLFDEAAEVLLGVWSTDSFEYEGRHFTARGQIISPGPVQKPHPPLWLGGNAAKTRERVARWAQGWAPMRADAAFASVTRTAALVDDDSLRLAIADLSRRLENHGRTLADIDLMVWSHPMDDSGVEAYLDQMGTLAELGATWTTLRLDSSSFAALLDGLRAWGEVRRRLG